jgi:hypothetical protein
MWISSLWFPYIWKSSADLAILIANGGYQVTATNVKFIYDFLVARTGDIEYYIVDNIDAVTEDLSAYGVVEFAI